MGEKRLRAAGLNEGIGQLLDPFFRTLLPWYHTLWHPTTSS